MLTNLPVDVIVVCSVKGDGMATDDIDGNRCLWVATDELNVGTTMPRSTIVTLGGTTDPNVTSVGDPNWAPSNVSDSSIDITSNGCRLPFSGLRLL